MIRDCKSNIGGTLQLGLGATVTVQNSIIKDNTFTRHGSCVLIDSSTFIFNGGEVSNCISPSSGAAFILSSSSSANIAGVNIHSNVAKEGAAFFINQVFIFYFLFLFLFLFFLNIYKKQPQFLAD